MKVEVNITKSNLFLVFLFILFIGGAVVVYSLPAGEIPNPGHGLDELGAPSSCEPGQVLQWGGNSWNCADPGGSGPSGLPLGYYEKYWNFDEDTYGTFGGSTGRDTCNGDTNTNYTCLVNESRTCEDSIQAGAWTGLKTRIVVCKSLMVSVRGNLTETTTFSLNKQSCNAYDSVGNAGCLPDGNTANKMCQIYGYTAAYEYSGAGDCCGRTCKWDGSSWYCWDKGSGEDNSWIVVLKCYR